MAVPLESTARQRLETSALISCRSCVCCFCCAAWMGKGGESKAVSQRRWVKGGDMGGFGGCWLEHPRQWLGDQGSRPEEAQEPSWGTAKRAL